MLQNTLILQSFVVASSGVLFTTLNVIEKQILFLCIGVSGAARNN